MAPSDTISFARGAPSLDIVDVDGLRDSAVSAFMNDPGGVTGYGTSIGYPPLRRWIAEQHGVDEANVLVTNGSMQADAFLFATLVSAGDAVVVEKPTYDRTLLNLRSLGADVRMVSLQTDGIDVDELAELLATGVEPKLVHIIPNFQNPAGYTLSLDKRKALLALAAEHDFVIFEDDPYRHIRFTGEDIPTMIEMDESDTVVYASSFSKTVCPGIRVGYLVGPKPLIAQIQKLATNTYISPSMVSQAIVHEFCVSGRIDRSIATVKAALAERVEALTAALEQHLPEAVYQAPEGGYFMWVTLPEDADVDALFEAVKERGVQFVKGSDFLLEGGHNMLRLAYSGVTVDRIDEGIARLADGYRSGAGAPATA
jgi:DNA-binding transcriptional MocR family regulator